MLVAWNCSLIVLHLASTWENKQQLDKKAILNILLHAIVLRLHLQCASNPNPLFLTNEMEATFLSPNAGSKLKPTTNPRTHESKLAEAALRRGATIHQSRVRGLLESLQEEQAEADDWPWRGRTAHRPHLEAAVARSAFSGGSRCASASPFPNLCFF